MSNFIQPPEMQNYCQQMKKLSDATLALIKSFETSELGIFCRGFSTWLQSPEIKENLSKLNQVYLTPRPL